MIGPFTGEYAFLSNFHPSPIVGPRGLTCPTVEHAFQAAKAMLWLDAAEIAAAETPGRAKRMGRRVMLRPDWADLRLGFMEEFVWRKFQIPDLRERLLDTGDEGLVEINTWGDTFWGVCNDVGENNLGRILMSVRAGIRHEQREEW